MSEILNIAQTVDYDDSITKIEYHNYSPFINKFDNNDEIRISIHHQDLYVLPSESLIYIEGKLVKTADGKPLPVLRLTNNAVAFLFEEIRYELNGVEIDRNKNVGITSTIKNKISLNENEGRMLENAGWKLENRALNAEGSFNYCIPLKNILGFAEDYKKIVVNAKHELILIRSRTDLNAVYSEADECNISISKIIWRIPHVTVANPEKLSLLEIVASNKAIQMAFRSWDLYEYPSVPRTTHHTWAVKTVNQLEKPRYVIFVLQTNRKNLKDKDASRFDHCNLTDFKVHLNSEMYPYNNLNIKYNSDQYALVYDMYCKFQQSYYNRGCEPLLTLEQFKTFGSMIVVDCSRQNEIIKIGPVDIKLEFKTSDNIPENTSAYCLLIHDRIVQYNPLTSEVQK